MQRVLKPEGYYMVVTYGKPENRLPHLQRENLSFDIKQCTVGTRQDQGKHVAAKGEENDEEKIHYLYFCKKRFDAQEMMKKNWARIEDDLKREYEDELKYPSILELLRVD